jgi:hypothetical protein
MLGESAPWKLQNPQYRAERILVVSSFFFCFIWTILCAPLVRSIELIQRTKAEQIDNAGAWITWDVVGSASRGLGTPGGGKGTAHPAGAKPEPSLGWRRASGGGVRPATALPVPAAGGKTRGVGRVRVPI